MTVEVARVFSLMITGHQVARMTKRCAMTSMIDNQVIELRKLLDERGIEYVESQDRFRTRFRFNYCEACSDYLNEIEVMGACITTSKSYLTPEQAITAMLGSEINGDTSDGYHTFNELYHHRAVLFSVIVRDHRELAWKARKHHDGTMYDGMFIVGIETPKGQATYHYDLDPYWEMFDCEEREYAPEWDGHTPDEAIARIAKLRSSVLTVEQVREVIERHSAWVIGNNHCFHDGAYEEIADELNAMLKGDA